MSGSGYCRSPLVFVNFTEMNENGYGESSSQNYSVEGEDTINQENGVGEKEIMIVETEPTRSRKRKRFPGRWKRTENKRARCV